MSSGRLTALALTPACSSPGATPTMAPQIALSQAYHVTTPLQRRSNMPLRCLVGIRQ